MGNQAIRNGEITPNNFATRPGRFSKSNILTKPDYLFGSNMGLTAEENNLSISQNAVRTRLPIPISFKTPKLGSSNNTNQAEYHHMMAEVHPVQMERITIWDLAKANPVPSLVILLILSYPAQKLSNEIMKVLK